MCTNICVCRQGRFFLKIKFSSMISLGRVICTFASGLYLIWKSQHRSCTLIVYLVIFPVQRPGATPLLLFRGWAHSLTAEEHPAQVPAMGWAGFRRKPGAATGEELLTHRGRSLLMGWPSARGEGCRSEEEREGGPCTLVPFQTRPWWREPPKWNKWEQSRREHIYLFS